MEKPCGFGARWFGLASAIVLVLGGAGCEKSPPQKWPGPCEAMWTIYHVVEVGGFSMVTPVSQGNGRLMTFSYDERGLVTRIQDDQENDGQIDFQRLIFYDEQNRVVREALDDGGDDTIEAERVYVYHSDGSSMGYSSEHSQTGELVEVAHQRPLRRLWEQCQGECVYDEVGNLLEDKDRNSQDAIYYSYECWQQ